MRVGRIDGYLAELDESAASRVLNSLRRTAVGNDLEDYVTPLVPDGDPDYWRGVISTNLFHELQLSRFPWLLEAEEEQKSKIGAYSQMLPYTERKPDVHAYFAENLSQPDQDMLRAAVRNVAAIMPDGLNVVPLDVAIDKMPKGTNLGAPYFTSDERYIPGVAASAEIIERAGFVAPADSLPALMFWRGQPRGLGQVSKNRTVWGISHIVIAHGLRVQIPLLQHLRQRVQFAAWNASDVIDRAVGQAFEASRKQIISVDFSRYDASLHPLLMEAAWMLIRRCFSRSDERLINWLQTQMNEVPLLTPEGIISGSHAMPSGDANTNLIDGLCQELLWNYLAILLRRRLVYSTVQGDDGIVVFDQPVDIEEVADIIHSHFGMTLSAEKGMVAPDTIHFLQNVHNRYYSVDGVSVHVRPVMRALNGMLSYERLVKKSQGWSGFIDTIRWWQQCENCKFHPSFDKLVKFLYSHDRYSRLDPTEVMTKAGGIRTVASALKQPSFPYGKEPLSGLAGYKTVKMLSKLRANSQGPERQE